jgi:hypothetical protein
MSINAQSEKRGKFILQPIKVSCDFGMADAHQRGPDCQTAGTKFRCGTSAARRDDIRVKGPNSFNKFSRHLGKQPLPHLDVGNSRITANPRGTEVRT